MTSELLTLATIGGFQLLAVISPGPSFLITARTAVALSRIDGVKVALGLGAGTVIWSTAALLGLKAIFQAVPILFMAMKIGGEYSSANVTPEDFEWLAQEAGLSKPMVRRRVPG